MCHVVTTALCFRCKDFKVESISCCIHTVFAWGTHINLKHNRTKGNIFLVQWNRVSCVFNLYIFLYELSIIQFSVVPYKEKAFWKKASVKLFAKWKGHKLWWRMLHAAVLLAAGCWKQLSCMQRWPFLPQ